MAARYSSGDLSSRHESPPFLGRDPDTRLYDLLVKEQPLDELIVEARPKLHLLASNSETLVAQDFARLRNAQADLVEVAISSCSRLRPIAHPQPPPQGLFQECAIYSADLIIIPVPVDYPGMDGAAQFVQVVEYLQSREKLGQAPMYLVPMFVDARTSESRYNLGMLRERFSERVLTPVPVRTRMREAIADLGFPVEPEV